MADRALTLTLNDDTAGKIAARAKAMGIPPEQLAAQMLETWLAIAPDPGLPAVEEPARAWADATGATQDPHEDNAAHYDLNEVGRPWSEVRPEMEALLERKLAQTR